MKATELRIGNWYQVMTIGGYWDNRTMTIENLKSIDGCSIDVAKTIPLTEEWLKRFGFEKYNLNNFTLSWGGVLFYYRISDRSFRKGYQVMEKICFTEVKYVHQLQNLYFAITGEELNQNK